MRAATDSSRSRVLVQILPLNNSDQKPLSYHSSLVVRLIGASGGQTVMPHVASTIEGVDKIERVIGSNLSEICDRVGVELKLPFELLGYDVSWSGHTLFASLLNLLCG